MALKEYFGIALFLETVTKLFVSKIFCIELILFIFAFWQGFNIYRRQQRSDAAVRMLYLLNSFIDDIENIRLNPDYYTYEGYYPWGIPEKGSREKDLPIYSERPSRLIFNRICQLKKDLGEPVEKISGNDAKKLNDLLLKFGKILNTLMSRIGDSLKEHPIFDKESNDTAIEECCSEIQKLKKEFERILNPIVHGRMIKVLLCSALLIFLMLFFLA